MKYSTAFLLLAVATVSTNAFQQQSFFSRPASLKATSPLRATLASAPAAKEALIGVAERLKNEQGVLIYDSSAKSELEQAVAELEAVGSTPTQEDFDTKFQGDWVLICTTATGKGGIDTSKLPFFKEGPIQQIRQALNRSVKVVQSIKSTTGTSTVDRIDHIIEYMPPKLLSDVIENLPDALKSLNLNPLELTKSKVSLVHKAEVTSVVPKLSTKLSLESIVLNVAGESQFLDATGADVLGVNVPLIGDFVNAGTFETTYIDDDIRISRSKLGGVLDQLRVFMRAEQSLKELESVEAEYASDLATEAAIEASDSYPSDVEMSEVEWVDDAPVDDAPVDDAPVDDVPEVEDATDGDTDESAGDDDNTGSDDYPSDVEI